MFYFKLSLKESKISMCDYDILVFTSHFPCISAVCAFMKVETKHTLRVRYLTQIESMSLNPIFYIAPCIYF